MVFFKEGYEIMASQAGSRYRRKLAEVGADFKIRNRSLEQRRVVTESPSAKQPTIQKEEARERFFSNRALQGYIDAFPGVAPEDIVRVLRIAESKFDSARTYDFFPAIITMFLKNLRDGYGFPQVDTETEEANNNTY